MATNTPIEITPAQARDYLVGQLGLRAMAAPGPEAVPALLSRLRCIQLDPLDRIGTNADLVAIARIPGLRRGEVYQRLLPGHAFEHFAKERCLLPASAFPYYRDQAAETPWWRLTDRLKRLPPALLDEVLAELTARGPLTAAELADRGRVDAIDWNGWKGTAKAGTMALEVLWLRCDVVVCGRRGREKVYDIPSRALPAHADATPGRDFARWALLERVEAAGLLATAGGPWWSMLGPVRTSSLPDQLVAEGLLQRVVVRGSRRGYLAPAGFRQRRFPDDDGQLRVLAPLDPLIWDRKLVQHSFGFEYVWEVYKPAAKRRWGYYVCPLLHRGELVGRIEGRTVEGRVVLESIWEEDGATVDRGALDVALERLATPR